MTLGATTITTPPDYAWFPFPIPGHSGEITAAFLNRDLGAGPIAAVMQMAAGARIPAHVHDRSTEAFLVLEGRFINAGTSYGPGAFFTVKPGEVHGPHEAPEGARILFLQSEEVDPSDFRIAE
ncbi:cupin domain-containing protein [Falsiroseomonas tokyonensis]|uniref:Cupin domain-containing protein n=1 Tax=Falsiroseomonas tokyonensis TaxID=430521 RepID=A0ABV7BPB0_9PROT|nr:cupin domain-containing protein [Falsiroseomonas tokyonensis]MBU8537448.1 cupin domain-containing protein [Falsiroseomonas tokyonensis]